MAEHHVLPATATADAAVIEPSVAVLPVGAFEQHGPHLPLATDTLVAVAISNAIAEVVPVRQLPPVTIGCSHEHAAFPGTLSISATTLAAIVADVAASLRGQGIEHLIVVNGHGGNYVLSNVVQQANAVRPRSMALYPNRVDWDEARAASGMTTTAHEDMHAGELEASILLAAWPEYLGDGWQEAWTDADQTAADRRHLLTVGMDAYTTTGIIGRPSLATEAKGQVALHALGQNAVKVVEILTSGSPSQ
ncbi:MULTISPECIES: creatininase family protein [Aeromicrobium]|uniref:creatininase family protein n=1 Tax=Aeromicrobium TaxID=2040 RepID=UPI00257F66AD|nr:MULTISPECIES: creatininase family protein [Aeromicrobium]